jgi:dTDP-4-dehydrorhamnose 3,5-epimerase
MRLEPAGLPDLFIVRAAPLSDPRGSFARVYCRQVFADAGIDFVPEQMSVATNRSAHTLRGMHWQAGDAAERKLVRVTRGAVHDVVVDLRERSPTWLRWIAVRLEAGSLDALLVPPGCAHGYLTLEDDCELMYAMDRPQNPAAARGLRWDDPTIGIGWPQEPKVVSARDQSWPRFDPAVDRP